MKPDRYSKMLSERDVPVSILTDTYYRTKDLPMEEQGSNATPPGIVGRPLPHRQVGTPYDQNRGGWNVTRDSRAVPRSKPMPDRT